MSLHAEHHHIGAEPPEHDACMRAMTLIQDFLHQELDETAADVIREHLMACESCMDVYDVEAAISQMIKRCCRPVAPPATLRARVTSLHIRLPRQS